MNITTIEELKKIGEGEIVELSPFDNGAKLVVRLKKPDVSMMIIDGKIPNPLVETALKLINEKDKVKNEMKNNGKADIEKTRKYYHAIKEIAKNCLVAPTYNEIETFAGGLNITQLLEIFNYAIGGAEALKSFRSE